MKIFQKFKNIKKLPIVEKTSVNDDVVNNDSENTKPFKLGRQILLEYMDKKNEK